MPVTIPRNEEMALRAREMYVPGMFGIKRIAKELGISCSAVRRYVNPERAERDRVLSLAAKRRRTGICERCGGETRYNGSTINGPSLLCAKCNHERKTHCPKGHPLSGENLRHNGKGYQVCRTCRNEYMREWTQKKRRAEGRPERDLALYESRRVHVPLESEGATQNG